MLICKERDSSKFLIHFIKTKSLCKLYKSQHNWSSESLSYFFYHIVNWVSQTSLCVDENFFNKFSDLKAQGTETVDGLIRASTHKLFLPLPWWFMEVNTPIYFYWFSIRQVILVFTWLLIALILFKP